ncbi:MAG: hypothetical protein AB7T31_10075 [Gemmatimonadales bacterium]
MKTTKTAAKRKFVEPTLKKEASLLEVTLSASGGGQTGGGDPL